MNYLYLILNILTISIPLLYSFDDRISYAKKWKYLFPAIFITATFFIAWDVVFTYLGMWSFNERYLITAAELQESLKALAAHAQATTTASGPTSSAASTFALLLRACRQCHSLLYAPSLLPELFFPFEQQASVYVFCSMFSLPSFLCFLVC